MACERQRQHSVYLAGQRGGRNKPFGSTWAGLSSCLCVCLLSDADAGGKREERGGGSLFPGAPTGSGFCYLSFFLALSLSLCLVELRHCGTTQLTPHKPKTQTEPTGKLELVFPVPHREETIGQCDR